MIKNLYNKYKIFIAIILAVVLVVGVVLFIVITRKNTDGMNNKDIFNVKYKVYQNGKWSKYTKNGMTIGDKEHPIQNIEFKYNEDKGGIFIETYTNEWSGQEHNVLSKNLEKIYGIKILTSNVLYKKYNICYRTYNKKDKWLNWTCSEEISGNKEEPITAIEVKLIPKKVIKFDYLKDFNEVLESNKNF